MTGATGGAGTGYPSGTPEFTPFMCMFCRSLFVLLAFVLSVFLRFTDSDYPFDIFKLFCLQYTIQKNKEYKNSQTQDITVHALLVAAHSCESLS